MVKDAKVPRASFPKDIREGLLRRIFDRSNLKRLMRRACEVPKRCRDLAVSLDQSKFKAMLKERLSAWKTFDASLETKWKELRTQREPLYQLFKSVQARGGWNNVLGLGQWTDVNRQLGMQDARHTYEQHLSIIDPGLHPESEPCEKFFPWSKLRKWQEVPALPAPETESELRLIHALDVCIFRQIHCVSPSSLHSWAAESLHVLPLPATEGSAVMSPEPKEIHNALSLGAPLLLLNHGHRPCSATVYPEDLTSVTFKGQLPPPCRRHYVIINPGDVLLIQRELCVQLIGRKTWVTRLTCMPSFGQSMLELLKRADLSGRFQCEVPFPVFSLAVEILQRGLIPLGSEERYQLASHLMDMVADWDGNALEVRETSKCSVCKKELFLVGWSCECGASVCSTCRTVSAT